MTTGVHWTDAHITYNADEGVYVGWDETGCDYVIKHVDYEHVVNTLVAYANKLEDQQK